MERQNQQRCIRAKQTTHTAAPMSLKAHQEMAASPTEDNYKRALGPKN